MAARAHMVATPGGVSCNTAMATIRKQFKGPLPDRLFGKAKYSRRESRCLTRTDIQRLRVSREERRWRRVEAGNPPGRDDPWPRKRLPVTFSEATAQNVVIVTDCSMLAVVQSYALRCAMP
jgi:hypothetical protein